MHINNKLKVSVIIPTLNAGASFSSLLDSLINQSLKPDEIIIIDSESTDDTATVAIQHGASVIPVNRKDFDHGGTRNIAANHASGDVLVFMTQDVIPYNQFVIEKLVDPFISYPSEQGEIAYCYARQMANEATGHIFEKLAREVNYPSISSVKGYEDIPHLGIKTFFCSNACAAIRKDLFMEQGGFTSPTIFNEDMFMAARLVISGKRIAYCAEAIVYHTHHYTVKQQFKRYFDNGLSMRTQQWILPYAKATKAGSGLVKRQLSGLFKAKKLYLVPLLVIESAAKFIGYKLGMNVHRIPKAVARKLSMHTLIFEQIYIEQSSQSKKQSTSI